MDNPIPALPESVRYLALGDSYTIGEGVQASGSFPSQLMDSLIHRGMEVDTFNIIARTGWTTDELSNGIKKENPAEDYNLVSLLIGVNNQFRGRSIDDFEIHFESLLLSAIRFAQGDTSRIFVFSIPDYGVTPFGLTRDPSRQISQDIDAFNFVKKKVCNQYNVLYFDITGISRLAEFDDTLLASDRLHPSTKMYSMWISKYMAEILEIVN